MTPSSGPEVSWRVRQAVPEDANSVASLIHLSGPDIHRRMMGGDEERMLSIHTEVFRRPQHLMSYDNTLVVELEGEVCGIAITYPANVEIKQGIRFFRAVLSLLPWRQALSALCYMIALIKVTAKIQPKNLYGAVLATAPEMRRRGAGVALMEAAKARVRALKLQELEADVDIDNHYAWKIYQRFGFEMRGTYKAGWLRSFLGFEGHYRISLPVSPSTDGDSSGA